MKRISLFLLVIVVLCALFGCSNTSSSDEYTDKVVNNVQTDDFDVAKNDSDETNNIIELVAYLVDDINDINAHVLSINLFDWTLDLSQDELFRVSGEIGWQDSIYPLSLSSNMLVLPSAPLGFPAVDYAISCEEELYFEDYILLYNYEQSSAEVNQRGQAIAALPLFLDDVRLIPQAFFIDSNGKLVVLCISEGDTFDKVNPVSLIFFKKTDTFELESVNDFSSIFDENGLSKINMPNHTRLETNIYGNAQSGSFLWNEGANTVEINPYDGSVNIVLTVKRIENDMPALDTYRDFYEFFTGFSYQNGLYIAKFPNYNELAGTISVFYSSSEGFLGSVLCTDSYISLSDGENNKMDRVENADLMPISFIPQ